MTVDANPRDPNPRAPRSQRAGRANAIIDAALRLAARRRFEDVAIADIAADAGVSLADFRDAFPSKGAVIGGFWRRIDRAVLDQCAVQHLDDPARERLFGVLRRRLEAMEPWRDALASVAAWAARDPLAAAALNRETVNSMRFMLEAADIENDGTAGAIKLQGLAFAWSRVLDSWFETGDMTVALDKLDRLLDRGAFYVDRADDIARMTAPLHWLADGLINAIRPRSRRERHADDDAWPHAGA